MQDALTSPVLMGKPISLAAFWIGYLYLPALVSPEQAPVLYLVLIFAASGLAGLVIFLFSRFFYRDMPVEQVQPLTWTLLPATFLTTLIIYQAAQWPAVSVLMVSALAIIHFRSVIHGTNDLLFVAWTILSGLLIGMGFPGPVLLLNGIIGLTGYIVVNRRLSKTHYRFIVRCEKASLDELAPLLRSLGGQETRRQEQDGIVDLVFDVRLRDVNLSMVERVAAQPGVHRAVMITSSRQEEEQPAGD